MSKDLIQKRPADFEIVYLREGWRGIERIFGARTAVNTRWLRECGGVSFMRSQRTAYLRHMRALHDGALSFSHRP